MLTRDTKTLTVMALGCQKTVLIVVTAALLPTVDLVVQKPTSFTWAHKFKTAVGSTVVLGGHGV